jgi:alkanesulfonate monooxygenase
MHRDAAAEGAWITRNLWTGLVPFYGPVWTTLAGTPREIADVFLSWRDAGVEQFILSGWPELDTVQSFGRDVLPLIREAEA